MVTWFLNKILVYQRVLTSYHFGQTSSFFLFFESTYIKQIISNGPSKPCYGVSRFIDDLCVINDGCKFAASFKNICHKELELKIKHQGIYASFLDFDIKIKDSIFLEKLFDKRDKVPFFIV